MATKVRIQRFVTELTIPSEDLFDPISQKAANFINRNIPSLIDQAIGDLDPDVDYIIDSIEIDLDRINFENIQELNQSFLSKFKDIISIKLANAQVDKTFKFEKAILDFVGQGKFPWWMDQTATWGRGLPKKKLSKAFIDKISSLLSVSKEHFFRLKNLLIQKDFEQLLRQILKKDYPLYTHSLQLLEKLVQKTQHKWISPDFDKKALQYFLISAFSKKTIDKKEILYQFLNRFASQTRQDFSSVLVLSVSEIKESKSGLDQILQSISQQNQSRQSPQNLNQLTAISILTNYFEKGFEEIPTGYTDLSLLRRLLRNVLNQNKNDFISALKSLNLKGSPIKIQRFLFLLHETGSSLPSFFLADHEFPWMSEIVSLFKSSQVINLLERQSILFGNKNLDHVLLTLVVEENIMDLDYQALMEKLFQIIALDNNMEYSNLVKELFLSFKSGSQQTKAYSVLEDFFRREVSQKLTFKPQVDLFGKEKDAELANQLSFFQRQAFEYFKNIFTHSSFEPLYKNTFDTSNDLLSYLLQVTHKIKEEKITDMSLVLLRETSTQTKTPFSTWVESIVKFINQKTKLNSFDHQILAKFTREQFIDDDKLRTIFRYDHQKKLNPQQEEIITFLLKLFPQFKKNKEFKIKFLTVEAFEIFLVNFFEPLAETNLSLLIENAFSQITIHTQIPYRNIVAIVFEVLKDRPYKTALDQLVLNNYKGSAVENFDQDQPFLVRYQLDLDAKGIPFLQYKRILFLLDHLEKFLGENSTYKKPEKLFDFLAQGFPATSSSYEINLKLLDRLAKKIKISYDQLVTAVIDSIKIKDVKTALDFEYLANFDKSEVNDQTEFRYDHQKKLNPQQEEIITFLLKLFPQFKKNKEFKIKFLTVEAFEIFLVNFFEPLAETNLSLLIENAFSQITIHTQIPYRNIVAIVFEVLKDRPYKTALDQLVLNNYKGSAVENFDQDQPFLVRYQLDLDAKGIPFLQYKRILFLLDHLEKFLGENSTYKKPEKLFDFLAQGFPATSSSYEINLKLLDRLAKKIKISYDQLVTAVIDSIKIKDVKTSLDFEYLANFDKSEVNDQTDLSQDKLLFTISEGQNFDHFRKSIVRFFFTTFLKFKNQKNYKVAFKNDLELVQFVFDQLKPNQNKSFELQIPLLFQDFGKRIKVSISNLYLVTTEDLISRKKTDELSRRLLSTMILDLLELHSPKFNFGATDSSLKNADDLMINLSKHQEIYPDLLLQLVYFPNFISKLSLVSFLKAIRQLVEKSSIRFEWIENSLKDSLRSTRGNLNTRIRFLILKILLDSKMIDSETQFQKILQQHLLRHDPDLIKEGIINAELKHLGMEEDQTDGSTVGKIIDLLSKQKDQFISPAEENSFEKNQFDYLLQYKNDILISKNQVDSKRIQIELDDFESILSDSDSLLFFLTTYANDLEILLSFTELVLSEENEKILQLRLDQMSKKFLRAEHRIIGLQSDLRFANLKENTFKILLRAFLFKAIGTSKKVSNFSVSDFTYGFLEHLSRERYMNLRVINEMTFLKATDTISQEINLALSVFTDRGIYFGISKRVRDEVYFKDLSIAVIKNQQLPEWALSKSFSAEDAWAFVISKIEDQDYEFTSKLIKELSISEGFLKSIEEKPTPFFINLFQQIQNPHTEYDLSQKFQELIIYFSKHPWNAQDQTEVVLSRFFLSGGFWKGISLIQLSQKIFDFLKDRSDREPAQLKREIRQALAISDTFFSFQKFSQMDAENKIELIKYFFETGQIPEDINFDQAKIKADFKEILLKNTKAIKKLWKEHIGQPEAVSNILKIISKAQLIRSIEFAFFRESIDHQLFVASLFKASKDSGVDKKRFSNLLRIIRQFIIDKALKEKLLISFFTALQKADQTIYTKFLRVLNEMQPPNGWDTTAELGQFLTRIDQKGALEIIIENQDKIDLERLEYFVEFGSTQFDDTLLGMDDLYQLFKKLLSRDRLLIKKRLHQWGNSKNKIKRIIKLHPQKEQILLLDHIHFDLASYLTTLDQLMADEFNTTLPIALGLEHWEGLIAYNFGYWSSKNLIVYSLRDLIQMFVAQLLKQLSISKEDLNRVLIEGLKNTPINLKNQLRDWISQLESPSNPSKKQDQISEVNEFDETGSLFIQNAGLILLWPFISRLFDKLNLLEDKNFVDENAQQKAILLTQYLVTGNTDFQESSLALNKLICGAPIETYVDVDITLEKI